jgi:phage-related tail fiber protein
MPNIIRIKRRVTGAAGAPTGLKSAELAYNMADNTIYAGYGDDGSGNATAVKPIGGEGTFAKLDSPALTGTPTAPTPAGADNSTKLATTAFIKGLGYLTTNNTITISGDASGAGTTAIALTLASVGTAGTYAKVTTDAKGRVTSGTTLSATDIPALTAAKISDFDTQVRTSRLDQMAAPTATLSLNAQKIGNLADPTAAQDAATKAYVDAMRQGLDVKDSVRAATTANITLSATQTVDGVALVAGDRVLIKDQSTASANGIYVVAAGAWVRATDADSATKVTGGMFTFVEEGTANADSGWVLTTNSPVTLGTTSLAFTQFSGAGQVTAGTGLTKTGNTLDVGAGTGIQVNADDIALATSNVLSLFNLGTSGIVARTAANTVTARTITGTTNRLTITNGDGVAGNPTLDIASSYAGQNTITTLGTVTTGTWNGSTLAVGYGGTGVTTLTGLVKGNGASTFTAAVDGTDYLSPNATIDGGTF